MNSKISRYKTEAGRQSVEDWVDAIVRRSTLGYKKLDISTKFGNTRVLAANHERTELKPLLFIPGARTCGAFWDLNDHLHLLGDTYRVYLVDVVGQPSLSDGNCPGLKGNEYGIWLDEVCEAIGFEKGCVIGASFGGLLIFKLAAVAPQRIDKAVLMNPVGLSYISLSPISLFYTLLPVFFPTRRNVETFIKKIVFSKNEVPDEKILEELADYIEISVRDFVFAGEYPDKLSDDEIATLKAETHLILGEDDALIPHKNSIDRAKRLMPYIKSINVLPSIGHGIEISEESIKLLRGILMS